MVASHIAKLKKWAERIIGDDPEVEADLEYQVRVFEGIAAALSSNADVLTRVAKPGGGAENVQTPTHILSKQFAI